MRKIYLAKRDDGTRVLLNNVVSNDIAFHLVDIMDVSNPTLLASACAV